MTTLSPFCVNVTVPDVALPLVASSRATADCAYACNVEQTASTPTTNAIGRRFMGPPGTGGERSAAKIADASHHMRTPPRCQTPPSRRVLRRDGGSGASRLIGSAPYRAGGFKRRLACVTLPPCSEGRKSVALGQPVFA